MNTQTLRLNMNASAVDRRELVERVRAAEEALGPAAATRFDQWAAAMAGEIYEFNSAAALERAFVAHESVVLDSHLLVMLRRLVGREQQAMTASAALATFQAIDRDRLRRVLRKVPGLIRLLKGVCFILDVAFCTMTFVLVSEGAHDAAQHFLHR